MAIRANYQPDNKIFRITEHNDQYKIEVGDLQGQFKVDQTVLVPSDKPELFWKLLNNLLGIPSPTRRPEMNITPTTSTTHQNQSSNSSKLRLELEQMSAKEIIDKVYKEKGVKITNSLKSKAAIISKALRSCERESPRL